MFERHIGDLLRRSLAHFPVVLITGARQVGKSTLANALIGPSWRARYLTLDDRTALDAALRDPDGFVGAASDGPLVIDEVQRAPDLLRAVKLAVDRDRRPGRFLLTGSAHVVTLSRVAETLAGRAAVQELHPLSWSEIARRPAPGMIDDLFDAEGAAKLLARWPRRAPPARRAELMERILAGGFPTPVQMRDPESRRTWFDSYRQTYVERDLRDLAEIRHLPDFSRLLILLAARSAGMLNLSDVSRDARLPLATLRRYFDLLEQTYQLFLVRPYFANVAKQLVKTPKLHLADSGLCAHLTGADSWRVLERQERVGAMVETWVAGELRKLLSLKPGGARLSYWGVHHGGEVDFLLERGGDVVGIEVKWGAGVGASDLAGLRSCRAALGRRFRLGVLLHSGEEAIALDDRTVAVPFSVFLGRERTPSGG